MGRLAPFVQSGVVIVTLWRRGSSEWALPVLGWDGTPLHGALRASGAQCAVSIITGSHPHPKIIALGQRSAATCSSTPCCTHPHAPQSSFGEFQGFKSTNALTLGRAEGQDFHGRVAGQTATVSVDHASPHAPLFALASPLRTPNCTTSPTTCCKPAASVRRR